MLTREIPENELQATRDLRSTPTFKHPDWFTSDCWA